MVRSSSGNKLYTLYQTKSLGRPRRFSDLTQDDRYAYISSHCETLRNLCHVVSGTESDLRFLTSELPALYRWHNGDCVALIQRMIAIYEFDTDSKEDTSFEIP